jgi:hypothetical protein
MTGRARLLGLALAALLLASGCDEAAPSAEPSAGAAGTPQVACLGVPAEKCAEIVKEVQANGSVAPAVAIQIRCTVARCTEQQGQVSLDVLYASGQRSSSGQGWAAAAGPFEIPPPVLTVAPTCIGVAADQCRNMAESAIGGRHDGAPIQSIVVRCTGVCNIRSGEGTTIVTYGDGTTDNGNWEYSTDSG